MVPKPLITLFILSGYTLPVFILSYENHPPRFSFSTGLVPQLPISNILPRTPLSNAELSFGSRLTAVDYGSKNSLGNPLTPPAYPPHTHPLTVLVHLLISHFLPRFRNSKKLKNTTRPYMMSLISLYTTSSKATDQLSRRSPTVRNFLVAHFSLAKSYLS